ncbi:MAG: translational GTPase TypA [Oscillospiraceae bacterium]|nr:translational GTPase TypA [Oscillospiraceae bacterium]
MIRNDLRNIAIVAHVDHGKTTLVDQMLKQTGAYRDNQVIKDRVMDSNTLERERGITIVAKNTSICFENTKINIIDTPGHADFGGEVERVLKMVDGVILLVDAAEGPMPQTRFVTQKALDLGLKIIVVVNKIDRPDSRLDEISDEVLELLLDLDASEEQLESPILFCSGRSGTCSLSKDEEGSDLMPLFNTIIDYIDPPSGDENGSTQVLVSAIDYNDYVGRIAIGKVERGSVKQGQEVTVCDYHNQKEPYKGKVVNLYQIGSFDRTPTKEALVGDIVCFSGIENITIGDTICKLFEVDPLPFVKISEPTVEMTFAVNDSPFAGREGKFVTSRQINERLNKELLKDVSLKVSNSDSSEKFNVLGRGEMHLSILIETMRREGFELSVSTPRVLFKEIDNKIYEPIERITIDVPEEFLGSVMEKMGLRKAEMTSMSPKGSRIRVEFLIPSRGLFGYRNEFLTDTKGEGIMNSMFDSYQPYKGPVPKRSTGSLISFETGEAVTYGLYNAQERGTLFISPGTPVYEGMVVGCSPKQDDLVVNVCKKKHVTNMRASGSDEALRLTPSRKMSLEESLEFLAEDELLEVTPKSLRIRKAILSNQQRAKNKFKK